MSTLIKDGRVITGEVDATADVYVEGERVALIGESLDVAADRVIEAQGKYVLPGCVDVHTHMDLAVVGNLGDPEERGDADFGEETTSDDFTSGTVAAAFGGTTTIVDFAEPAPGETLRQGVAAWHAKLERTGPVVDVGFHVIVRERGEALGEEVEALCDAGVTSLKLFMAYKGDLMVSDEVMLETMQVAARNGALVMVHAENGDAIDVLIRQARSEGRLSPRNHALTRPPITEAEAVHRAIELSRLAEADLYVVHVSCAAALDEILAAQAQGARVWGETCTQYLFCDESDLDRPNFEGAKYVFTPPPRTAADRSRLWEALAAGQLPVISTDHSPSNFQGSKTRGRDDFSRIPNGAGGVEERLMMIHEHGVRGGRISLNRMVELLATNPAKLLGLYPRKGSITVGGDADIVIFDPDHELEITSESMHSRCDYTLFEGTAVHGVPETVLVRGTPVVEEGRLVADPGHGRFVERARFGSPLPGRVDLAMVAS